MYVVELLLLLYYRNIFMRCISALLRSGNRVLAKKKRTNARMAAIGWTG